MLARTEEPEEGSVTVAINAFRSSDRKKGFLIPNTWSSPVHEKCFRSCAESLFVDLNLISLNSTVDCMNVRYSLRFLRFQMKINPGVPLLQNVLLNFQFYQSVKSTRFCVIFTLKEEESIIINSCVHCILLSICVLLITVQFY